MDEKPYPFESDVSTFVYRFESRSPFKVVQKVVLITETGTANVVNLALLDELDDGELSDTSISANDDMATVLATVFRISIDFLNRYPHYAIAFRGSDDRRNRLYRMALGRELEKLTSDYDLYGFNGQGFVLFDRNESYGGFLIRKCR